MRKRPLVLVKTAAGFHQNERWFYQKPAVVFFEVCAGFCVFAGFLLSFINVVVESRIRSFPAEVKCDHTGSGSPGHKVMNGKTHWFFFLYAGGTEVLCFFGLKSVMVCSL